RKVLLRLPRSWLPVGQPYGHVFAFDESGRIVEDLQDPTGAYTQTTGVTETKDRRYIHSLNAPTIGWLPGVVSQAEAGGVEEIYVLRSIREASSGAAGNCAQELTGFAPMTADAEKMFSFWSVSTRAQDGRILDAHQAHVADLRGCFGATDERARQNFYAEIKLGELAFHGNGECLALAVNFPESGLFPVRCQLTLKGLPAPYVGGMLTTNTMTSAAPMGGESQPPGYTQASIATIRLWKERARE
ncbi:MAG TPA: hypothetical protein VEW08_13730, partial [Steroidobacteraceae bacterium]|nr:hypothetical protein [Steroidobacteraceae bacterium]